MKVLFIHNKYKFRGGEDTALEVEAALLITKGHEVRTLEFDNNEIDGLLSKLKTGLNSFYNTTSAHKLEDEVLHFKPDVIHIHNLFFQASPSVIYKALELKVPVVITLHNYRLICANAILMRENRICELCINKTFPLYGIKYKCYHSSYIESALVTGITGVHKILSTWKQKVDHYIAPSNFIKTKICSSSLNIPEAKISVKPNFIYDVGINKNKKEDFFLFVGRLTHEKGIDVLLKCFESDENIKLVIAGDGPEKEAVLERTKSHSNINYIGQQPKETILDLMRKSKALIFPSIWYEGLPITIIEAFSTGTPVIASKLGAMAEMIFDGYNGFHFKPDDHKDLRNCIDKFLSLESEQEKMNWQARLTYEEKYHPDIHYQSIIAIYQKVIEQKKE